MVLQKSIIYFTVDVGQLQQSQLCEACFIWVFQDTLEYTPKIK